MKTQGLKTMELSIGINAEDRQQIADGPSRLLADS